MALPHIREKKGVIIDTNSVTAHRGSEELLDYSSTKGAIVAFTRSLAKSLAKDGVRVYGVASVRKSTSRRSGPADTG